MATLISRGAATRVWFAKIGASQVGEGLKKNKTKKKQFLQKAVVEELC